jgi:hypothetical protein
VVFSVSFLLTESTKQSVFPLVVFSLRRCHQLIGTVSVFSSPGLPSSRPRKGRPLGPFEPAPAPPPPPSQDRTRSFPRLRNASLPSGQTPSSAACAKQLSATSARDTDIGPSCFSKHPSSQSILRLKGLRADADLSRLRKAAFGSFRRHRPATQISTRISDTDIPRLKASCVSTPGRRRPQPPPVKIRRQAPQLHHGPAGHGPTRRAAGPPDSGIAAQAPSPNGKAAGTYGSEGLTDADR